MKEKGDNPSDTEIGHAKDRYSGGVGWHVLQRTKREGFHLYCSDRRTDSERCVS